MKEPAEGTAIRIIEGVWSGSSGVIRDSSGEILSVEVVIFGRPTVVTLPREHVLVPGDDIRDSFRKEIVRDFRDGLQRELDQWWTDRISLPESDLAGEWGAFEVFCELATAANASWLQNLLATFDESFGSGIRAEDSSALAAMWSTEAGRWKPHRARWLEMTEWVRDGLYNGDAGEQSRARSEVAAAPDRAARAVERRDRAAYASWRRIHLPPQAVRDHRERGKEKAAASWAILKERVRRTHGLILPEHVSTFLAFWTGLTTIERHALRRSTGVSPVGILNIEDLAAGLPGAGAAPESCLDWRSYRDPPEFLTVMMGATDGLRFGLWFDRPQEPSQLVASYFARDGGDITWCGATLIEAVRHELEWTQFHLDHQSKQEVREAGSEGWLRVSLVREAIMELETGDRPEKGAAYHERYPIVTPHPRVATVNGVGVVGPAATVFRDVETIRRAIETGAPEVDAWLEGALLECAAGRPTEALALGHDLHWLSGLHPEREAAALRLLDAAYRQLGRGTLADLAEIHHRHRHKLLQ
ncbi:ADP-ribosylation family protein [Streptomyces bobili]|uniref:ADP-ribosylation family protein n=1 Tax=Streptomyces bobili TaxID=67280 RepID=UPI003825253A